MKKFTESVNSLLGNETIGSANVESDEIIEIPQRKRRKKTTLEEQMKILNESILEESEPINNSVKDNSTILETLGIPLIREIESEITSQYIDEIVFTDTSPKGLSDKEVTEFCNDVADAIDELYEIIEARENDFNILLDEVSRLTDKMTSLQYENELARVTNESESKEEILRNELITIKDENFTFKNQLDDEILKSKNIEKELKNTQKEIENLKKQNENLKKQNEELTNKIKSLEKKHNIKNLKDFKDIDDIFIELQGEKT